MLVVSSLDSKVHGANMGPTWVLSAPGGPHVGPMNLAIRGGSSRFSPCREDHTARSHCPADQPDHIYQTVLPLHWRHNDHDGVWIHQPHGCLLNRLFRRRSKKTSKLRVTCPDQWIPRTKGQLRGKCFHLMTSSYEMDASSASYIPSQSGKIS